MNQASVGPSPTGDFARRSAVRAFCAKLATAAMALAALTTASALVGCSSTGTKGAAAAGSADEQLLAAVDEYARAAKRLDPFFAAALDVEEDLDKFGDFPAPEFFARAKALFMATREKARAIDPAALTPANRRLRATLAHDLDRKLAAFDFPRELLGFHQMENRLQQFLDETDPALTSFPFNSTAHYEKFLKKSEGFPAYVDRQIELFRRGVREKITMSCAVAPLIPNTYKPALEKDLEKNPFYRPILKMPDSVPAADRARLAAGFKEMIRDRILPGYRKFDRYYWKEYVPHCRKGFGLASLPGGARWYEQDVASQTDQNDWKAAELHQMGLQNVERIEKDLQRIKGELGFKGSLAQFKKSLSSDPRFSFKSQDELFAKLRSIQEQTLKVVPKWFSLIPKSECRIAASSNPEGAAGMYVDPSDNAPYGRFVVNALNLRAVTTYEATTLSAHESIPGHHFQLALQYEMKGKLTEYQRKLFFSNAFVEGWAFYSEWLGNEMGLFADPVARLGNRTDDLLRQVRLVVDTGIHSLGWSQAKAFAYMKEHLPGDAKGIENEANRYSVLPGQALGYEVGRRFILDLRREAERELGSKFDVREFHARVLENGMTPLPVLRDHVRAWIASTKNH